VASAWRSASAGHQTGRALACRIPLAVSALNDRRIFNCGICRN